MRGIVLPDMQIKPGSDLSHIDHIAQYIVDKKPDFLVDLGDWADMQSLSSYDVGKKSFEGRRYRDDIDAGNEGLERLNAPIKKEQERLKRNREKAWKLEKEVTGGNHDYDRIERAIENDRKLEGLISTSDLDYAKHGYKIHRFLEVAVIQGIAFSHYFCSGIMGRPVTTARALLTKKHMSCIAGHQPGYDVATDYKADGKRITAIIAGSGYPEDMPYLNDQTNKHWRGIIMLNDVCDGEFEAMQVSLKFLRERYQ